MKENPVKQVTTIDDVTAPIEGQPVRRDEAAEKIERLKALGLHGAARVIEAEVKELKAVNEFQKKLYVACENFRVIKPEKIAEFNAILKHKTLKVSGREWSKVETFDQLVFLPLEKYSKVPPDDVLESLEKAKEVGCFDSYEVGVLESVEVRPDPLLLGRVKGSDFRFFISQWDNDVKIEDILKSHEG